VVVFELPEPEPQADSTSGLTARASAATTLRVRRVLDTELFLPGMITLSIRLRLRSARPTHSTAPDFHLREAVRGENPGHRLTPMAELFWVVVVLVGVALEVHTNQFVTLFLALSGVLAFLLALLGVPFDVQALVWLAASGAMIALLRPFAVRSFSRRSRAHSLSRPADNAMTGLRGVVELAVGDEGHPGRVRIQGETWRAVTEWPDALPDGTAIVVRKAYGTTLWVEPA